MKSKRLIIEWVIASILLLVVLPVFNVKISTDEEEMISLLIIQIKYINPPVLLGMILSQFWRIKKAKRNLQKRDTDNNHPA